VLFRSVAAMGDDADRLCTLLDGWCDQVVAQHGYPVRIGWPDPISRPDHAGGGVAPNES